MEEPWVSGLPPESDHRPPDGRRDLKLLCLLVIFAAGIRVWLLDHTEVVARDGVGFIRYAWQLGEKPWVDVLRSNPHPPLYPLTVLAVSLPVRSFFPASPSVSMQFSAQLTSVLAGILLVIPMYYLGRTLFDQQVGFWAALIFQALPVSGRVLSDALSEGVFLLLVAGGVLLATLGLRKYSAVYFTLAGLCGGLAYLTRPEGLLIVAGIALVLIGLQTRPANRHPWSRVLACEGSLLIAALAVSGPYMAIIGGFTNKTTGKKILETACFNENLHHGGFEVSAPPMSVAVQSRPLAAGCWASWCPHIEEFAPSRRLKWSLAAVCTEVLKSFHYSAWLPMLLGLYWCRERVLVAPGLWILLAIGCLDTLLLFRVAYSAGYLADRHTLILLMGGLYWATAGIFILGQYLAVLGYWLVTKGGFPSFASAGWRKMVASGWGWSIFLLLLLTVSALPKTLEPLHFSRAGYHAAGVWLAHHIRPGDSVLDPFCWAEYYAGRSFSEEAPPSPPGYQPSRYIIMGDGPHWKNPAPELNLARAQVAHATQVFHWAPDNVNGPERAEEVSIYQLPEPATAAQ
jgi:hypothetical protein